MDSVSLKYNYEFSRVFKRGEFSVGAHMTLHAFKRQKGIRHNLTPIPAELIRVGFCANKRQLGAVGRNRARRLMREAYRHLESEIRQGYDLVFTLKNSDVIPSYTDIYEEMQRHLKRLRLLKEVENREENDRQMADKAD